MGRTIATDNTWSTAREWSSSSGHHRGRTDDHTTDGSSQASPVTAGVGDAGRLVVATYPERTEAVYARRTPAGSALVLSEDWNGA